jgi:hypothetical protein
MQHIVNPVVALMDVAYTLERGNDSVDFEAIEAAETRALRSTTDGPLQAAIRDTARAATRLLRCRRRDCVDYPYVARCRECRVHLQSTMGRARNRQRSA